MPQACLNCRGINPNPDNDFCPICTDRILDGAPPALQVESERRAGEMNTGTDNTECHGTDEMIRPTGTAPCDGTKTSSRRAPTIDGVELHNSSFVSAEGSGAHPGDW